MMSYRYHLAALLAGLLFALGLGISGMTLPSKVIGFLDVTGAWDPTLAFVMGGALLTYAGLYRAALAHGSPAFSTALLIPTRRDIDGRLLGGAALFGVGWGLSGFCPGPALTSLVTGRFSVILFVCAMVAGMAVHAGVERMRGQS